MTRRIVTQGRDPWQAQPDSFGRLRRSVWAREVRRRRLLDNLAAAALLVGGMALAVTCVAVTLCMALGLIPVEVRP